MENVAPIGLKICYLIINLILVIENVSYPIKAHSGDTIVCFLHLQSGFFLRYFIRKQILFDPAVICVQI